MSLNNLRYIRLSVTDRSEQISIAKYYMLLDMCYSLKYVS
jgi:hypothetical protein